MYHAMHHTVYHAAFKAGIHWRAVARKRALARVNRMPGLYESVRMPSLYESKGNKSRASYSAATHAATVEEHPGGSELEFMQERLVWLNSLRQQHLAERREEATLMQRVKEAHIWHAMCEHVLWH